MVQRFVCIKKLRIAAAYSPYSWGQIIKQAGISGTNPYRYFNGSRECPLDFALKVAVVLKTDEFITDDAKWLLRSVKGA